MSQPLNPNLLAKFLKTAGEKLSGRWLLVGGTLLPALGIEVRSTVDIDLLGLGSGEAGQQLELMELAETLGLPVESINQAGAFFLRKAGYTDGDLILLHKGAKATIFRPSLELYWKLKIARLSETDLQDCEHYLKFCRQVGDSIDTDRLMAVVKGVKTTPEKMARVRRRRL